MMDWETVVRSRQIVCPHGILDGWIGIQGEKIGALGIGEPSQVGGATIVDAENQVVLPGMVDTHVHIRYPGHPEREDFATGTAAAAAGGVTTILEMPISLPPPWNAELLTRRMALVTDVTRVDIGFYGAGGFQALPYIEELAEAGAIGYKIFLHRPQRGREAEFEGLWAVNSAHLQSLLTAIAATGLKACVHGEDDELLSDAQNRLGAAGRQDPLSHVEGHPILAETLAVTRVMQIASAVGARLSVCHLSSGSAAEQVRHAKRRGMRVTAETCPHYLFRTTSDMTRYGPYAKINPPLRDPEEQAGLWQAVWDQTIDFIGSDHSPYTVAEKERGIANIWDAPAGCPGLETTLPLLSKAVADGRLTWLDVARLTAQTAATEFGLPQKGAIALGRDADLVMLTLEPQQIDRQKMQTKSREIARIYEGESVPGRIAETWVRGAVVFRDGQLVGAPSGRLVKPARG